VQPRGRLVLKSTFAAESEMNLSRLVVDEVQLLGSRCGPLLPVPRWPGPEGSCPGSH